MWLICASAPAALAQQLPYALNTVGVPNQGVASANSYTFANTTYNFLLTATWNTGAAAGYAFVFDAATLPANGAVNQCTPSQAAPCVAWCAPVAANSSLSALWGSPLAMKSGDIIIAYSTTGCATFTGSPANMYGQAL